MLPPDLVAAAAAAPVASLITALTALAMVLLVAVSLVHQWRTRPPSDPADTVRQACARRGLL